MYIHKYVYIYWLTCDHTHSGMLSLSQVQKGLDKTVHAMQRGDLMRLLEVTGMTSQEAVCIHLHELFNIYLIYAHVHLCKYV
jgi:hypothetical protein